MDLVGKPVTKKFPKFGVFKGVIDSYDAEAGYYKILYEDGDSEDADLAEVQSMLIEAAQDEINGVSEENQIENGDSGSNLDQNEKGSEKKGRKRCRLSELGSETSITPVRRSARQATNAARALALSTPDLNNSETGEKKNLARRGRKKISEIVDLGPKLELPPSSKNLDLAGLPVLDFFMVYSSLRSFTRQFFLSPFKLEAFLSALKCSFANPLIDSVHFSLLHALKKHLEVLCEQGSQSAAHCIRNLNWDLLDLFTWPVFLAEYLLVHGSEIKPSIKLPDLKLLSTEYYKQPPEIKLELLRCLCDDVMEAELIHSEIDLRTGESDANGESSQPKKRGRKPKYVKELELVRALNSEPGSDGEDKDDKNIDECYLCRMDGNLLCCDGCPNAFHSRCVGVAKDLLPEGEWYCPECSVGMRDKITKTPLKDLRGGDMLGVDLHGRVYFWSSDYLLVSESYETADSCNYYSKSDIISVLKVLNLYYPAYRTIIDAISCASSVSLESSPCNGLTQDIEMSPKKEIFHSDPSQDQNLTKTLNESNLSTPISHQIEWQNANFTDSEDAKSFLVPNWGKTRTSIACDKDSDPTCYINSYSFGRLAFAISVEFVRVLAENKEQKKPIEDISILQLKAISNVSSSFCWYSYQKFPIDIQKESCGWCFQCRTSEIESERSNCIFLSAFNEKQIESLNKPRGFGFRSEKNKKNHISSAIHYILLLEERLKGLLVGLWENPNFSDTWRKEVSKALDVKSLSKLLLQLENNLRRVAFLADWTRPVDSTAVVGSAVHISIRPANVSTGSVRKRGRPGRKSTIHFGSNNIGFNKTESNVGINWWRGGSLSREVFHWKRLPQSLAFKAARQGGLKKIPTIIYPEGSDIIARRIKCVAWRASLEMSESVSHLIFQIKEFESYIKWAEIGSSLPFPPVTKESKRLVKQFKKVIVWRKITEGPITKYLLDFGKKDKKKNIPPIVAKYGTKIEEPNNERVKYWLGENYVPLHLLKAFEEKKLVRQMKKKDGSTPAPSEKSNKKESMSRSKKRVNPCDDLSEPSSKKQRRLSGFDHLFEKAEKSETKKCGRCNKDVLISEAVNCQSCEGYFHRKHFKLPKDITAALFICIKCKDTSAKKTESMKSPKKQKSKSKLKACSKKKKKQNFNPKKKIEPRRSDRLLAKNPQPKKKSKKKYKKKSKKSESKITNLKPNSSTESEIELTWPKRKRTVSPHSYWLNGLHWTRKLDNELNINFLRSKIIFPTEYFEETASKPVCSICVKEYNSQYLYISCDKCEEWFHGDAYQVKSENIFMLIGFKCHKCRKRNIPLCPHMGNSQEEPSKNAPQEQNKISDTSDLAQCSDAGKDKTGDFMNIDEASKPDIKPKQNDWTAEFMYVVPQEDIIEAIFGGPSSPLDEAEVHSMEIEPSNGFSQMDLAQTSNGEPSNNGFITDLSLGDSNKEKSNGEGERESKVEERSNGLNDL